MGLMDAFNPEATTTIKVGELYRLLEAAATNKVKADFLLNGVKSEVPYRYIREVVTGEKESDEKDPIVISVDHEAITGILENIIAAGQQDEDENFTKEELSKKSGVSRSIINGLETGRTDTTTTKTLFKIAKALDVGINELFSGVNA